MKATTEAAARLHRSLTRKAIICQVRRITLKAQADGLTGLNQAPRQLQQVQHLTRLHRSI